MAKKKTQEEMKQEKLIYDIRRLEERVHLLPDSQRKLKVGQKIDVGSLPNAVVEELLYEGKVIEISHDLSEKEGGGRGKTAFTWMDVKPKPKANESFSKRNEMRINFSQRTIDDILSKAYHFGIDFEPDYQRDYVWNKKNKVELIESIFENIEIGKFVFVRFSDEKMAEVDYRQMYEILDGKQRTRAILDFYEGKFKYKGYYFHELTAKDQRHFENYSINVAEVRDLTEEQALRYFISLNTAGKQMDKKHLDKLKERLSVLEKENV